MSGSFDTIDRAVLVAALERIAVASERDSSELNRADGALGDGDLGVTVSRGFSAAASDSLAEDVGQAFLACSKAFQRVSSSSFGTLIATAFMAVAKQTKGRTQVPMDEIADLVAAARDAVMARGKAEIGDKTVVDSLDALARDLKNAAPSERGKVAVAAASRTIEDFKGKHCRIGRARMFAEKSANLPDPGQLALLRIVQAATAID